MLGNRHIRLGRILGIPVEIDLSWFLIVAVLSWTLAVGYFPTALPDSGPSVLWAAGLVTAILLFVSVLVHELAHSLMARRFGVPVRRITLFIFGGVSELGREPTFGIQEFWIAVVGPATSFLLAGALALLRPAVAGLPVVAAVVGYLALINLVLGIFNLIPGFPLDGGNVLRAILWQRSGDVRRATIVAANVGRGFAYGFIFLGLWLALAGALYDGLWIMFIGWFLENAAVGQIQQLHLHEVLERHVVAEAVNPRYAFLPARTTLRELADWHVLGTPARTFLVRDGDRIVGVTSRAKFEAVPPERWDVTTVRDVMDPVGEAAEVTLATDLWTAVQRLHATDAHELIVRDAAGRVVGTLDDADVTAFIRTLAPETAGTR